MRTTLITCILLAVGLLNLGCWGGPTFSGEWLEDRAALAEQSPLAARALPRMALQFDPVSTVRSGWYRDRESVVDNESVQSTSYFVFDGNRAAQFGAMTARMTGGDHITVTVGKGIERMFTRVHGKSIFPPHVQLPTFSRRHHPPLPDRYAAAWSP
jgi:hypothetical protein